MISRVLELLRTRRTLFTALGVLLVGAFVALTDELREGKLDAFDQAVLLRVFAMRTPHLDAAAIDLTALGSATVLTLVVVAIALFLYLDRELHELLQLLVASCGGALWTSLLKNVLERERPSVVPALVEVAGFSYPSGHSLTSASVYLTVAFLACHRLETRARKTIVVVMALGVVTGIGASRAYIGAHYPSDVAAGLLLGTGWALFVAAALRRTRAA